MLCSTVEAFALIKDAAYSLRKQSRFVDKVPCRTIEAFALKKDAVCSSPKLSRYYG